MTTTRFDTSLAFVLKWEGSKFTNDPADRGGPTRFGVIQKTYDAFRQGQGLPVRSVEAITMDEVGAVYRRDYWNKVKGDDLGDPLDLVAFDTGVNMGVGRSAKFLQQSLGVGVDGAIGSQTLNALAGADKEATATRFLSLREQFVRGIVQRDATQQRFLNGWLNRLNDLRSAITPSSSLESVAEAAAEPELQPEETVPMARASLDVAEDFKPAAGIAAEDDPGAPAPDDVAAEPGQETAASRDLANFGVVGQEAEPPLVSAAAMGEEDLGLESVAAPAAPTLPLDIAVAQAFLDGCMNAVPRVTYGLGAKVPFHGAVPGKDFKKVDCSGFIREAIWRATSPHQSFPDGSVVQHDWIRDHSFERTTPAAALQPDGVIRIAFLRPQDSPQRIGHVVLIHDARTLESHGGVGPDSRPWTNTGWQAKALVYVLAP
jgi:lysozyme family protein